MHVLMRTTWVGIALLLTLGLSGCAGLGPKLETPRLTLVSARLASGDMFSQQFQIRVHVANPNDRELPIKGIDYKLFLEGDSFAEGVSNAPFVVPALGETEFDMTLKTNFMSSIGRLLSRLESSNRSAVRYSLSGKVLVDMRFIRSIPFSETGTVDLGLQR
jgi:LEA14-like dessication related protein